MNDDRQFEGGPSDEAADVQRKRRRVRSAWLAVGVVVLLLLVPVALWRLWVLGHDVGDRWSLLSQPWGARLSHGIYAFNDVHAMMTFVATGDRAAQRETIATLERAAAGQGTNAMMSRDVGLPLARGLAA